MYIISFSMFSSRVSSNLIIVNQKVSAVMAVQLYLSTRVASTGSLGSGTPSDAVYSDWINRSKSISPIGPILTPCLVSPLKCTTSEKYNKRTEFVHTWLHLLPLNRYRNSDFATQIVATRYHAVKTIKIRLINLPTVAKNTARPMYPNRFTNNPTGSKGSIPFVDHSLNICIQVYIYRK